MSKEAYEQYLKKLKKRGTDWPRGSYTIEQVQGILREMQEDLRDVTLEHPQTIHSLLVARFSEELELLPIEVRPYNKSWYPGDWVRGKVLDMGDQRDGPKGTFWVGVFFKCKENSQKIRIGYGKRENE
jgi:hypothetical protein